MSMVESVSFSHNLKANEGKLCCRLKLIEAGFEPAIFGLEVRRLIH